MLYRLVRRKTCKKNKLEEKRHMRKKEYLITGEQLAIDGSFRCPKCKSLISPDDNTEEVYTVIGGEWEENFFELEILCKKCKSSIRLRWENKEGEPV
jgi:transcription initiation factor IIE alpha subunit